MPNKRSFGIPSKMSSIVDLEDAGGASVTVNVHDGVYFCRGGLPIPFPQHMQRVKDMKLTGEDVLLCGYPKSGTHSLWKVIWAVMQNGAEASETPTELDMLDFTSIKLLERTPSPRLLGSHFRFRFLPNDVTSKNPKIVYIQRNPRAVAVSCYTMACGLKTARSYEGQVPVRPYRGTWDDYLDVFLQGEVEYGSWFEHVRGWEKARADNPEISMHLLHYEDMKKDPVSCIQKLGEYLGKSLDEETVSRIAKLCEDSDKTKTRPKSTVSLSEDGHLSRKCRAGDWRHWFTLAQNDNFEKIYNTKMAESCFLDFYK